MSNRPERHGHPAGVREPPDQIGQRDSRLRVALSASGVQQDRIRGREHDESIGPEPGQGQVRGLQDRLELLGVTLQLGHRAAERGPPRRIPEAAVDLDPAAGALDVNQVHRVPGNDDDVDLEEAVTVRDLDGVQDRPVVWGVITQVCDHTALGIVDGLPNSNDPGTHQPAASSTAAVSSASALSSRTSARSRHW